MSTLTSYAVAIAQFLLGQVSPSEGLGFEQPVPPPDLQKLDRKDLDPEWFKDGVLQRTCCALGDDGAVSVEQIAEKRNPHQYRTTKGSRYAYAMTGGGKNGFVYTGSGGFIDLGHVRDCADFTRFFALQCHSCASTVATDRIGTEGGDVSLVRQPCTPTHSTVVAALAGAKLAYDQATWHEIVTYFPGLGKVKKDQKFSSFSPEDNFSNALGVLIGYRAFITPGRTFNETVDIELVKALQFLKAASKETTAKAMEYVEDFWWTDPVNEFPKAIRRNLNAVSPIRPWLVTDIAIPDRTGVFGFVDSVTTSKTDLFKKLRKSLGKPTPEEIRIPSETGGVKLSSIARLEIKNVADQIKPMLPTGVQTVTSEHFPEIIEKLRAKVKDVEEGFGPEGDQPGPLAR